MGFYDGQLVPRLIAVAMRHGVVSRFREALVPKARGAVLEIGIGSGLNIPYYSDAVTEIHGVDPSPVLLDLARPRARKAKARIELLPESAEAMTLPDAYFDTVLVTFTLCSVQDPAVALARARRALKSSGRLLFAEHGLAPDEPVRRWQRRLNPLWRKLAGGCNLDRPMDSLIRSAGFELTDVTCAYAARPHAVAYIYSGEARPASAPANEHATARSVTG